MNGLVGQLLRYPARSTRKQGNTQSAKPPSKTSWSDPPSLGIIMTAVVESESLPQQENPGGTSTTTTSAAAKHYEVKPVRLHSHTHRRMTLKHIAHLIHRIGIFLAALQYVFMSFVSVQSAMLLLRGYDNPWAGPQDDVFPSIKEYLGDESIRNSPLVTQVLHNSTNPVHGTLFLYGKDAANFTPCSTTLIFTDTFLRSVYDAAVDGASYNLTAIQPSEMELIVPIFDCKAKFVASRQGTTGKFVFLTRQRALPDHVSAMVMYLSIQQYKIPSVNERGPAAVATIQLLDDMRATDVDQTAQYIVSPGYPYEKFRFRAFQFVNITEAGLTTLRKIPPPPPSARGGGAKEIATIMQTACREGFYIKGESEQSNVNNYRWQIEKEAKDVVSRWRWFHKPVLHDSWAWVHGVQFFIGLSVLSNLIILCLATYRNFRSGNWWLGDAFVSISTSQLLHGIAVAASWRVNEFWALHEYAAATASKVAGYDSLYTFESPMRADLLTLYLTACGLIGHLFRERVDPLFAVVCFQVGYESRIWILQNVSSSIRDQVAAFSKKALARNVSPLVAGQEKITPMKFWTSHSLGKRDYAVVLRCLLPIFWMLLFVVVYILARKLYRHFYPDVIHVQRNTSGTATSTRDEALTAQKRVLTLFELATGAKLEDRFGVVAEYDTCIFMKGIKYASADGIYTTGFVIANGKFLLQTSDFWSIVVMKIVKRRYRNIFVYDVNGTTVQETARLVYPHTLTFADLMHINVGKLA